jgi:hypothetical protein
MEIALRNYQPFALTDMTLNYIGRQLRAPANGMLEIIKKITFIVLAMIIFPVVVIADLILTSASLAFRTYYPIQAAPSPLNRDPICNAPASSASLRILSTPYGPASINSSVEFMRESLREAFSFLPAPTKKVYQELIADGGVGDGEANTPDVYRWCTVAYIIGYLRSRYRDRSQIYLGPLTPEELDHFSDRIFKSEAIPEIEKAEIFLKMLEPLTAKPNPFVTDINKLANRMIFDGHYLKKIYSPAVKNIENFK